VAYPLFAVVRVPFPFSDRTSVKRRPAVILSAMEFQDNSGHVLLAMVTTAKQSSWPLDWPIKHLQGTGLSQPCIVRLKLFTLDDRLILGPLGELASADQIGVQLNLQKLFPPVGFRAS
jgi:mRNA interferase MazF